MFEFGKQVCNCKKEEAPVGEVFCCTRYAGSYDIWPAHNLPGDGIGCLMEWRKFTASNYDYHKNHDGYVCIFGRFFKREDVLFYEVEAFKQFKTSVQKKYPTKGY